MIGKITIATPESTSNLFLSNNWLYLTADTIITGNPIPLVFNDVVDHSNGLIFASSDTLRLNPGLYRVTVFFKPIDSQEDLPPDGYLRINFDGSGTVTAIPLLTPQPIKVWQSTTAILNITNVSSISTVTRTVNYPTSLMVDCYINMLIECI